MRVGMNPVCLSGYQERRIRGGSGGMKAGIGECFRRLILVGI